MGVLEIIGGILLIVSSLLLITLVIMQESQGKGLGSAYGSEQMGAGRVGTRNAILAKYTKYMAIAFFVVAIIVNLFVLLG